MGMLEKLPENLRELVRLRLENPEESLGGLGRRLARPVTKSSVKSRWNNLRRIVERAEEEQLS